MKITPLPFRPLTLLILLAACKAQGESATWTGLADPADNNWATIGNWTAGIASVPGTNPGETATFSGTGTPGLLVTPLASPGAVKFLNFEGSSVHTFASPVSIENTGAVTVAAETAAQTITATITGNGTVTNNSSALLTAALNFTAATEGQLLTFDGPGNITLSGALQALGSSVGGMVKNGTGTLTFPSGSNSNITGGFTFNAGKIVSAGNNTMGNKILTLNGGFLEMTTNAQTNYTGAVVNANFTISLGGANNQWTFGATSGTIGALTSTNSPVLTIQTIPAIAPAVPSTSYLTMALNTSAFDGTWKIGGASSGGALMFGSTVGTGGPKVRVDLGEAGVAGTHILGSRTVLTDANGIIPIVLGELKGANVNGKIGGRINVGTRSTGIQYRIGGLGTNTSFSGSFVDAVDSKGNVVLNGSPNATDSVAPDPVTTYARSNGAAGGQAVVELVKTGSGTLTLLADSTHTGGTVLNGGVLAVSSDAALGAAYDGSLRAFTLIPGATLYTAGATGDLPDTVLTGGNPTVPATVAVFSSQFTTNGTNNLFLSFSSQNNDTEGGNITNTATGSGYTSIPTVSFTGGTPVTEPATPPLATVRVKGLLTFDGGALKTNAAITSNRATVLAAGGGTIDTNGFDSTLSGVVNGSGSLTKTGAGKLALTGVNTYTGDTVVAAGTLSVNGTSITDTAKLSVTGGKVEVTANETVGTLVLGGVPQGPGTYGAQGSGAANPNDTYFTGTGILTVVGGAPVGGYSAWAATNAPGQTPDQDYDHDGVENGIEYFMGVTGPGFTALPVPINGKITWIKDPAYSGTFMIQTSDTMAADDWDNVPVNGTNPKDNGTSVEYTLPTGQGKLFSRLRVNPN